MALNSEIEGYASRTSVNRGEQIELLVNTTDPTYTIDVFRMGWYNGLGKKHALNVKRTKEGIHNVIVYCKANPTKKVIQAIDVILKAEKAK